MTTGTLTGCTGGSNGIPADVDNSSDSSLVGLTTLNGVITAEASTDSGITDSSNNAATYELDPTLTDGRVTWAATCTPATLC